MSETSTKGHPNRLPFEGVLTIVSRPSERAPSGARGHRVLLTRQAAEIALPSLIGMAVGFRDEWDGHEPRQKAGVITAAEIVENRVKVRGYLYARDFPEVARECKAAAGRMGMSYELADVMVPDMRKKIWLLERVTFTGAAILLRKHAAYNDTSFRLTGEEFTDADAARFGERMVASMQGVAE